MRAALQGQSPEMNELSQKDYTAEADAKGETQAMAKGETRAVDLLRPGVARRRLAKALPAPPVVVYLVRKSGRTILTQ
jgi:hypothetical protein